MEKPISHLEDLKKRKHDKDKTEDRKSDISQDMETLHRNKILIINEKNSMDSQFSREHMELKKLGVSKTQCNIKDLILKDEEDISVQKSSVSLKNNILTFL